MRPNEGADRVKKEKLRFRRTYSTLKEDPDRVLGSLIPSGPGKGRSRTNEGIVSLLRRERGFRWTRRRDTSRTEAGVTRRSLREMILGPYPLSLPRRP